ncbi:hypothetical protein [Rathayibacter tanaceti]|uniref:Uncharacterized protein n=2 Tax=Rathayibacter tanaceti TaxID=1671680 RepID=A0A166H0I3_9MICO|nr:hypothetical protein [Rathayibacter tanaceti]KZX19714.1 hypothetical protein ACH61_03191 [Rathayibacter tanaceti]TCO34746.1 hypothetical protein EV639_11115 [Rathayibacter tanaceti]
MPTDDRTLRLPTADERPTEDLSTTVVLLEPEQLPSGEQRSLGEGAEKPTDAPVDEPAQERPEEQRSPRSAYGTPPVPPATASAAPSTPFSLTSLILGVTSVFFGLTVIAPVAGLVFGILGLRREPTGRTLSIWGIVLNAVMLGIVLLFLVGLLFVTLVIPFLAVVSGSDYL